ncbi:methyltransferase family protein [Nonomuraea typhae]|uniref:methyltransferase family protein n=1 Tax=Nonomuraea typhae TaxID=2603600 RepID=UPI0012FC9D2D|nr:isoprenylcysteine carboxylmethyltransferase family protein [Nonomuraea typhae]
MRTSAAAAGTSLFFVLAPGVVAGLVPWWLTGWQFEPFWPALRVLGVMLVLAGATVIVPAFVRFVREGRGTPAPAAPPVRLVVGGFYKYVRNPMYVAVVLAIAGQALLFGQLGLLGYAALVALVTWLFARFYEEPALRRTFGKEYDDYRRAVPGWIPRLRRG